MKILVFLLVIVTSLYAYSEQVVDPGYLPVNAEATYTGKNRPVVLVDAAHHNFHTLSGRYKPFAAVLESDGYVLKTNRLKFTEESLKEADVLVIVNALSEKNLNNWDLPNYSAFTREEIEVVYQWVKTGGSLFLIADHLPWPKASEELAEIFGFHFHNSYVEVIGQSEQYFELSDRSLAPHIILNGIKPNHKVDRVRGFMGQGFLIPPNAKPLMTFTKPAIALMPGKSFQFNESTPEISATGWHQAATLEMDQGRVVVFGEAGMFTAQIDSDANEVWKMGLNADGAKQNERFLLNVMLWLSRKI